MPHTPSSRSRRALRTLAALACLGAAVAPASVDAPTRRLDLPIETPVYRVPDGATLPEGEHRYAISWSGLGVGGATITVRRQPEQGALVVAVDGGTHSVIDWLYRYRVQAHGRVQTSPFSPDHFVIEQWERGKRQKLEVQFPKNGREVRGTRHRKGRVQHFVFDSDNSYDIPSATYLLLSLDYAPGDRFELDTFTGRHRHLLAATVEARETIELHGAFHDALRLHIETRYLTDDDEGKHRGTTVWVSTQKPRRVLRARAETWVGALLLELEAPSDPTIAAAPSEARAATH